jgi:hypothetical protein
MERLLLTVKDPKRSTAIKNEWKKLLSMPTRIILVDQILTKDVATNAE